MKTIRNTTDNYSLANAFGYALYEMIGSAFRTASITSRFSEQRMQLHFSEMKREKQYLLEELALAFVNGPFREDVPASFRNCPAKLRVSCQTNGVVALEAITDEMHLVLKAKHMGGRSAYIHCRCRVKGRDTVERKLRVYSAKGGAVMHKTTAA